MLQFLIYLSFKEFKEYFIVNCPQQFIFCITGDISPEDIFNMFFGGGFPNGKIVFL